MAARTGEPSGIGRAAALIMSRNPLGGVCGMVCPDHHCLQACSRRLFDRPVQIPAIQATLVRKAHELGLLPSFPGVPASGHRIAIIGAGPAGLAAAAVLARHGHAVTLFDTEPAAGGMCRLIPAERLNRDVLERDLAFLFGLGPVRLEGSCPVLTPVQLLGQGYDAVLVTSGLTEPVRPGIPGEELAWKALAYLQEPAAWPVAGLAVAIIGGGAVAVDCAVTACRHGASRVELFALENLAEMPLTAQEFFTIRENRIEVNGRSRVMAIASAPAGIGELPVCRVELPAGTAFHPSRVVDLPETVHRRSGFGTVIIAAGHRPGMEIPAHPAIFQAGDFQQGPTSVVEAVAAGKNAATAIGAFLSGGAAPPPPRPRKSIVILAGHRPVPVPLETDFFGRPLLSPFLLSAAPPTDGYEQMRRAYTAGWPGGVIKTAFDGLSIHIPAGYMFALTSSTYGNCDNVSGHPLDRVCREVEQLRREFPDRLTMASTGGPVTGDDEADRRVWLANTRKLEAAGVMGIEYSLSCPQGGDGTKGDIVSQDAELTARIVEWVLAGSSPEVPKLFKLTAAVTAIQPIMLAIRDVLEHHPGHRAGVTLANTFPALVFRRGRKTGWEEGIIIGMSGEGVAPISNLTLARVAGLGVTVSGNGGPMDYQAAAHFLALGARTVQFCTIVMKHGYGIIGELHSGLSHLLAQRGLSSVKALTGCALPGPVTGFMDLPASKEISSVTPELCLHCGNCTRCPYLAITLDEEKIPRTDPARCIGCSICVQKCFAGALAMRARTTEENLALDEGGWHE